MPAIDDLSGKKTVVLDVHGILYQVFHTMREMSGPKGQPTGAAFGFVRDVMNILLKFRPDYLFCAFDMPGPTFRHEIYPQYKANRPPMPDDLRPQTVFVRRLLDALCVERLEKTRFEADDLLATVAKIGSENHSDVILVTADKDARQLISDRVKLYNLRKESDYTAKELADDWGIRPEQVVDFQTLVGDSTDNVPGIPLIGPKSAAALLQQYETLENIFAHTNELKGKKKENLENGRAQAEITRRLVRLDDQVPIEIDWEKGHFHGIDADRLKAIFNELGFRSLLPKITELAETFGTRSAPAPDEPAPDFAVTSSNAVSNDSTQKKPSDSLVAEEMPPSEFQTENAAVAEKLIQIPLEFFRCAVKNTPVFRRQTGDEVEKTKRRQHNAVAAKSRYDWPRTDAFDAPMFDGSRIDYRLVDTSEKFDAFLAELKNQPVFSIDTETVDCEGSTQVRPRFARLVGLSFCFDTSRGWYLPIRGPLGAALLDEESTLSALQPILESTSVLKMGQNIKFDEIVLRNAGVAMRGVFFDSMVADYLLHAGEQRHNLDDLAQRYLSHEMIKISELIGTGKNQKKMSDVPTDLIARYAGEDAVAVWRLYPLLLAELEKNPALPRLLAGLEMPLIDVLVEMESNGIAIDPNHFHALSDEFAERLAQIETEIRALAAGVDPDEEFAASFNLNSTQQLQRLLFDDLKLPVVKKTKTGRSTDYEVLEQLAEYHPLPAKLIEHRTATKLKGTYVDPIPELVHPVTGRVHASFNQVVTATGRLSSSDPNLQNIPVRTEDGKKIRLGFIPDRSLGFDTLISSDYSQIELRVLTHFSRDEHLTEAFENDRDIHAAVAAKLFDTPLDQVTTNQRRIAKTVNFGLVYGQSAFGLAKTLGIAQNQAADYIRTFFDTYPGIRVFFDRVLEECRAHGYVETILGRRRLIEGVRGARGAQQLNMPERTAINTVVQGSAADLMKLAMVNVRRRLAEINGNTPPDTPVTPSDIPAAPLAELASPRELVSSQHEIKPPVQRTFFDEEAIEDNVPAILVPSEKTLLTPEKTLAPPTEKARLLLQIHDELVLETTADFAPELARIVQSEMELGQPLNVPLKIDTDLESRWGECVES